MDDILDQLAARFAHSRREARSDELNLVHQQYLTLQQSFEKNRKTEGEMLTPYEKCLHKLVDCLNWHGSRRQLMEALPHLESLNGILELRAVMARIGYITSAKKMSALRHSDNIFPCILDFDDGPVIVTEKKARDRFKGFNADGEVRLSYRQAAKANSLILIQTHDDRDEIAAGARGSWFYRSLRVLRRPVLATLALTCAANCLTLATPLYTMNVYNRVIGSQALDTLAFFFAAIVMIIGAEIIVRRKRGRVLAYIGARIDAEITVQALQRVLTMPLTMTEAASVNKQIVQFRQFESVRDLLTGNLASTLLDLPFLVIFFALIAIIAGWLAVIPLALIVIFGVIAALTLPSVRSKSQASGANRAQFNRMSMELASKMPTIRELGAERLWMGRHSRVAQVSAYSMFHARFFETTLQTVAQILVMCAGLATIALGAYQVINGHLNTGALIAVMMVVWRILTPIQVAFLSLNRIGQLKATIRQLDRLMSLNGERRIIGRPDSMRQFDGSVSFEGVSFRYGPKSEPALRGVSFEIKHGEAVAISGPSGSGKSTILKMLLGLYQPQAGRVSLDGVNVFQLDVSEVRSAIGYMPQEMAVFYGSLAQNMLLANPTASEEDIYRALHEAGIGPDDPILAEGLERPIRYESGGLSECELARLTLARSYLSPGPLLLLDNPGSYLDHAADQEFIAGLKRLKGQKTIILATGRPSHIFACDRLIKIEAGMVVDDLPVEAYAQSLNQAKGA